MSYSVRSHQKLEAKNTRQELFSYVIIPQTLLALADKNIVNLIYHHVEEGACAYCRVQNKRVGVH